MIGPHVHKQPIIALYFEFENELKFYNLEARSRYNQAPYLTLKSLSLGSDSIVSLRLIFLYQIAVCMKESTDLYDSLFTFVVDDSLPIIQTSLLDTPK